MSYPSPDMILHESTEEEGPEGPRSPDYVPHSFTVVDQNPAYGTPTPGLVTPPGGYMDAKRVYPSQHAGQRTPDTPNMWFRVQHQIAVEESQLTANALREMEERRKFEWIVPEHLPSSPLCPLHDKYRGYSKGKCYWHKERKGKGGVVVVESLGGKSEGRGSGGWAVGVFDPQADGDAGNMRRGVESFPSPPIIT